ncbi:MAG: GNAT family N-acetyltransferase [Tannerella sp.]|jgi:diamine N-acetyltransferase|nr:GNAT family N-acetyltransferase [Tannerella sp.]
MQLLENEIIRLRAPEPEDLDMLYIWENDASLWETGNALSPYSRYTLKQYIADADKDIFESKQLRLIIELKASRTAIGNIDLYDFDPHHRRAGVGILIDASHQRRGYAKNALQLIMNYAFTFIKIHQLYAYIPVTNTPSLRLFERCGFETMGEMKDWLLTSDGYADVLLVSYINK